MGGTYTGTMQMNDTARRLRAQKAYSTDPAYLERMAREEETRRVRTSNVVAIEGGSALSSSANVNSEVGEVPRD